MLSNSIEVEIRRHSENAPWTYAALDRRQREIADQVREGGPGALLLSEVSPVITVSRRTPGSDLLISENRLNQNGISLFHTDRGGLATYHGPGQWVLFAVDSLERLTGDRRGVRKAVCALLEIALEVGQKYVPTAEIRTGTEMGVWGSRGKFAAVGVHVERGVLLHGLAINFYKTRESFLGLRPCGLDLPVEFLLSETIDDREIQFISAGSRLSETASNIMWRVKQDPRLTTVKAGAITTFLSDS
ncbi:MAG: hypothetical protein AABZ55_15015 [Bdellovibrionota bacterium]